ncbi:hypothetical protein TrispH2_009924 [Trichoplax sp. H2]|nr:hypothetical protein TrispH2_009924 [Trichoplax sp. H2]|eukprot:RDD38453.1 hypothetical protein TrispH2_009924 [Trichoplax sp. H2]
MKNIEEDLNLKRASEFKDPTACALLSRRMAINILILAP